VLTEYKECFGFDFLERYHKDGDELRSHVMRIIDDNMWGLFVNIETEERKEVDTHTSVKQDEKFK
jgi:hypothetical protein